MTDTGVVGILQKISRNQRLTVSTLEAFFPGLKVETWGTQSRGECCEDEQILRPSYSNRTGFQSAAVVMASAMRERTASESGGIAPDCDATHAPQRFPASFNVGRSAPRSK
jgi:hypothetical protein